MKIGDIIEAPVLKQGAQGDGIADLRGRPVYTPLALAGEQARIKLTRSIGDGYQGELIEVLTPAANRTKPPCPHFSQCGGCTLQHMAMPSYTAFKKSVVQGALRQHKLDDQLVRDPLLTPAHARRRLTLAALISKAGKVVLGFNARSSHHVVDVSDCPIARPELITWLPILRLALVPWLSKAKALDIALTHTDTGTDILITGPEPDLAAREAISALNGAAQLARISWRKNERSMAEPMLAKQQPIVSFGGVHVPLPAGAFLQPSLEGQTILTQQVLAATHQCGGPVIDLFAGLGTFSIPLAKNGPVTAVEGDAVSHKALAALRLPGLTCEQRDLFRDPVEALELNPFSAIVFDPPRAGAQAQVAHIARCRVPVVVAVSCNPGTFARDAATLIEGGYQLDWVQPVDQFLWSAHVELVARFSR